MSHSCPSCVCRLCGDQPPFERDYGVELGLCCDCAEAAANLWWKAHSGEFLTWADEAPARASVIPGKRRPVQ